MYQDDFANTYLPARLPFRLEIVQLHYIILNEAGTNITDVLPPPLIQFDEYSTSGCKSQQIDSGLRSSKRWSPVVEKLIRRDWKWIVRSFTDIIEWSCVNDTRFLLDSLPVRHMLNMLCRWSVVKDLSRSSPFSPKILSTMGLGLRRISTKVLDRLARCWDGDSHSEKFERCPNT
jgi:hypothetical protein